MPYRYIAIEGNIGAGKTTLAGMVAGALEAELILEEFEHNSFLPDFYREPERYAFPLEMSFLADRYHQAGRVNYNHRIVADYHISKSLVFAAENLKRDEYELFKRVYEIMFSKLRQPDIIVYLDNRTETLITNINKRDRSYERGISQEYLSKISQGYLQLFSEIQDIPVLILRADDLDFINNADNFRNVLKLFKTDHHPGTNEIDL